MDVELPAAPPAGMQHAATHQSAPPDDEQLPHLVCTDGSDLDGSDLDEEDCTWDLDVELKPPPSALVDAQDTLRHQAQHSPGRAEALRSADASPADLNPMPVLLDAVEAA